MLLTAVGPAHTVLAAERTALNFAQRLSGVATLARRYADAVAGTKARVVDTRKTTPASARSRRRPCSPAGAATTGSISARAS